MQFVTFRNGGVAHVGALTADVTTVVDLTEAGVATGMLDLIERFASLRDKIGGVVSLSTARSVDRIEILAPIPEPRRNIFCVGKNYYDHAAEFGSSGFELRFDRR